MWGVPTFVTCTHMEEIRADQPRLPWMIEYIDHATGVNVRREFSRHGDAVMFMRNNETDKELGWFTLYFWLPGNGYAMQARVRR